jgi:hypothetical protein
MCRENQRKSAGLMSPYHRPERSVCDRFSQERLGQATGMRYAGSCQWRSAMYTRPPSLDL